MHKFSTHFSSVALILIGLTQFAPSAHALSNQLKNHPSPYLALHGQDPVAWQDWGPQALQQARREGKLLYLSIGYFSCHWCHVMQRESYRDPAIAALLNRHFIPVKIDRELEPALDAYMIAFAQQTTGAGGWPLNVFVTPKGQPLYAILYAPPQEFMTVLSRLQGLWQQQRTELEKLASKGTHSTQGPGKPQLQPQQVYAYGHKFIEQALAQADVFHGGFGEQSKFPSVPQLQFILSHLAGKHKNRALANFFALTMKQMAQHALQDHIGGGFFRYTVDASWSTPHFEKMLYDNVQLAQLYLRAWKLLGNPEYREVGERGLDFMLREMRDPSGAFIASLSAIDSNNIEGGYYLWDEATLRRILKPKALRVSRLAWGLSGSAPYEAGYLPTQRYDVAQVARRLGLKQQTVEQVLQQARQDLLRARAQRQLPRDSKLLAGWNGLALSAYAQAAQWTANPRYRETALGIRNYLIERLWNGRELYRAVSNRRSLGSASIEDYAYVAQGLWYWIELTDNAEDVVLLRRLVAEAWRRFYSEQGWRHVQTSLIALQAPQDLLADGSMASPSAVLCQVSLDLAQKIGDRALRDQALAALNSGQRQLQQNSFWYASHVGAMLGGLSVNAVSKRR